MRILRAVRSCRRLGIEVLYFDKQIVVINKPNGLLTQATLSKDPTKLVC
jgi:23S rRNA-/tRNA-specific pseudouridylate synthase